MPDFFDQRRPHEGLTYDAFLEDWKERKDASREGMDKEDRKMLHYLNYNWDRQHFVHDEYEVSDDLREAVEAIDKPQIWMVLTEPWCGDSAFSLPVIAEAAALNDDVTLRILPRDENLDVMDQYLTGGSRSIPKLVGFSEDGTERFTWGPRPEPAQTLFDELKADGKDKTEIIERIVEHYQNGGYEDVDKELTDAVREGTPAGS